MYLSTGFYAADVATFQKHWVYRGGIKGVVSASRHVTRTVSCQATPEIKLITSDVDGTLLDSQQRLTPRVERAVQLARNVGVPLVVATGKAPAGPWCERTLPRLGPMPQPGVFMQGLVVKGPNGDVIFTRQLDADVIQTVIDFGKEYSATITAYSTDVVMTEQTDEQSNRLLFFGEPSPQSVGPLATYLQGRPVQKMLVMSPVEHSDQIRPHLVTALGGRAEITEAIRGMLEVLPPGASKGVGVGKLLEALDIQPENLMALGDGENDIQMLQMAAIGVHMGNAVDLARAAADVGTTSNDEDGVALAIEKYVLQPRGLSLDS